VAQRWVALLRGINVGKAKRVGMADLRTVVEELGYTDVKTVLATGNIVLATGTFTYSGAPGIKTTPLQEP